MEEGEKNEEDIKYMQEDWLSLVQYVKGEYATGKYMK